MTQQLHPWDSPIGVPCLSCASEGCEHCGWTGTAFDIARADVPRNEIVSRLWQGGHSCANCLRCETWPAGFDLVIDMRRTALPAAPDGYNRRQYAIPDSRLTEVALAAANDAASLAHQTHEEGGTVLIRCHWGLNRSSLVTGLTLKKLGVPGDAAVELIRAKRSPWALCNRDYEREVRR